MAAPRYLHGDTRPTPVQVATAQAVAVFDPLALGSGNNHVRPEDVAWDTNEATTRTAFVAAFVGVSNQTKVAGTATVYGSSRANALVCNAGGCYEYDAVSDTYVVGDLMGPAKQTGNLLETRKLKKVSAVTEAIARVVKDSGANATRVQVELISTRLNPGHS